MGESLYKAAQTFGVPFMVKARKGSYDGRGNFKVCDKAGISKVMIDMEEIHVYAEQFLPFTQELAVMVLRTEDDEGQLKGLHTYPAVETIHEDSICTKVFYPPRHVSTAVCQKARTMAAKVVRTLQGRGVFAVEMFLLENGKCSSGKNHIGWILTLR